MTTTTARTALTTATLVSPEGTTSYSYATPAEARAQAHQWAVDSLRQLRREGHRGPIGHRFYLVANGGRTYHVLGYDSGQVDVVEIRGSFKRMWTSAEKREALQ